ncbi:MAG: cytochrome C peroxidase [Saprospiraceae bacterium]|nr:cytochrome C peroxidase [Saprospiraceae bacterium]
MKKLVTIGILGLLFVFATQACRNNGTDPQEPGDLEHVPYDPQPYTILKPTFFPNVPVPEDNPMTYDGVQLGRRLFYDPILSADSTMSCASCHLPAGNFTDNKAVSVGIDGIAGKRSSMALLNIAYATNGLFWDGRAASLEAQALMPVEDPVEMHHHWPQLVEQLKEHPGYPALFRKAFGIKNRSEISKELAAKAIAQFERILISSGTSKYDKFAQGDVDVFDDEELDGYLMYFEEAWKYGLNLPDAQCFHCHGGITLTGNNYFNNGLDSVGSLDEFKDFGRFKVTGNPSDKGKFRTPTLRNIALSGPYMHDGRFQTLEQVIDNYARKGFGVSNEDPNLPLMGLNAPNNTLTQDHKKAIVKFLHTLTDTVFINNPDIQNPF